MKNKNFRVDFVVIGLALFAMFFGAGNLIFPPSIGLSAGKNWLASLIGFFLTGIGLPLLGIIALSRAGGLKEFSSRVSEKFSILYTSLLVLALGPLLAIPRTGATTFELGVKPFFPSMSVFLVAIVYFSITLFFTIKPSKIIDNIGKILTPLILILLAILIVKGIVTDNNLITISHIENPFSFGFMEGYQTMDALASGILATIVLGAIVNKGYTSEKEKKRVLTFASLVAASGLILVYGGLLYLGSRFSHTLPTDIEKTLLISTLASTILGPSGKVILGLCVSFACLTTSIGLTATVGDYFSKITKFTYEQIVIFTCAFSTVVATFGVEMIVKISVPILTVLYPVTIVLIILHILGIKRKRVFQNSVAVSLVISFIQIGVSYVNWEILSIIYNYLPLSNTGFPWLIPFIVTVILTISIPENKKEVLQK